MSDTSIQQGDSGARDAFGRFREGHSGNARGKAAGTSNKTTLQLQKLFLSVLDRLGGEDWLYGFAQKHPVEFFHAIVKLMPRRFAVSSQALVTVEILDEIKRRCRDTVAAKRAS